MGLPCGSNENEFDYKLHHFLDAWTAYVQQDHIAAAHELFPPAICAVALDVIRLLDDSALNSNKISGIMIFKHVAVGPL